ncbi:hypothetical protein [Paenibacillus sp. WLX2291]|uniref:hypothetical protein n=1 Tax=Paenibacillus sp. WLX2291 TaxID=3296934 RepID=UPI00398445CC
MAMDHHLQRGGIHFYNSPEALKRIAILKTNRTTIHGIDSFKLTTSQTQPILEHSIDYGYSTNNWNHAAAFIESKTDLELMFEIISAESDSTN